MTWLILISEKTIWLLLFKAPFDALVAIPTSTRHLLARDQFSSAWILCIEITVTPVALADNTSDRILSSALIMMAVMLALFKIIMAAIFANAFSHLIWFNCYFLPISLYLTQHDVSSIKYDWNNSKALYLLFALLVLILATIR